MRDGETLTARVADFIGAAQWDDDQESEFETLALEVFRFQFRSIHPYRRLCERLGKTPGCVEKWRQIPAVSANAFRHFPMFSGEREQHFRTFKSSGTSKAAHCSESHFSRAGLALMDLSVEANAARVLFPEGRRIRILALAPSPDYAPASIMSYGIARMIDRFGLEGSGFLLDARGMDVGRIVSVLNNCVTADAPVCLIGSSFGFVHLFDAMKGWGREIQLPASSRLMHAGGYKGRSREVDPKSFAELAGARLGLAPERVINALGMTELASQVYDYVTQSELAAGPQQGVPADAIRGKKPPPWMRTLLFDPRRGDESPFINVSRRTGLLRHFDLANIERPLAIQTEDLGEWLAAEGGDEFIDGAVGGFGEFRVLGRADSAELRGCSISLEEFYRPRPYSLPS